MGRRVKASISEWLNREGDPWRGARCRGSGHLPWTHDFKPGDSDFLRMQALCHECPVITRCAAYGLTQPGGFYAGIWMPWKSSTTESPDLAGRRSYARERLRNIVKRLPVLA